MDCIRHLGDDPFRPGDYTETDNAARVLAVKIAVRFAIIYYVDHAVKEVKVIHVQPAAWSTPKLNGRDGAQPSGKTKRASLAARPFAYFAFCGG